MCADVLAPARGVSPGWIQQIAGWILGLFQDRPGAALRRDLQRRLRRAGYQEAAPRPGSPEARWVRTSDGLHTEVRVRPGPGTLYLEVVAPRTLEAGAGSVWELVCRKPTLMSWVLADAPRANGGEGVVVHDDRVTRLLCVSDHDLDAAMSQIDASGALVRHLARPVDALHSQLRASLWASRDERQRIALAELVLEVLPSREATVCARELVRDELPEIRLLAASRLGQEGVPHLLFLLALDGVPTSVAVGALAAVARRGALSSLETLLPRLLIAPTERAARLGPLFLQELAAVGQLGTLAPHLERLILEAPAEIVRAVLPLLSRLAPERQFRALGRRLGRGEALLVPHLLEPLIDTGAPTVDVLLHYALEMKDDLCVRAAATCLARVGTPRSLAPLQAVAYRAKPGSETLGVVQRALREIRTRHPDLDVPGLAPRRDEVQLDPSAVSYRLAGGAEDQRAARAGAPLSR